MTGTNTFYEAVFAELVSRGDLSMAVHVTGDRKWTEVDTVEDLREAEAMFPVAAVGRGGAAVDETAESVLRRRDLNDPEQDGRGGRRR